MAERGKSINLFLMDGTSTGPIKCTLANWNGLAFKIPRTKIDICNNRDDLKRSGVYFLFGKSDETQEEFVYFGQAGIRNNGQGILYRIQEHMRNPEKDWWTEVFVLTTSNDTYGSTEISYLENRFCGLASEANRYKVKNMNNPTQGNITEEKRSELEDFVDNARIVMGALGYRIFEPLINKTLDKGNKKLILHIKRSNADAKSQLTDEGIVVLAGSLIREILVPSCPDYVKTAREKYKNSIDPNNVLLEDILFKTPSGASCFVLGAPTNGNVEWKTEEGTMLKDL